MKPGEPCFRRFAQRPLTDKAGSEHTAFVAETKHKRHRPAWWSASMRACQMASRRFWCSLLLPGLTLLTSPIFPGLCDDGQVLLQYTDHAMYQIKRQGR